MKNKNAEIIRSSQFINNFGTAMTRISLVILISTWFSNPMYVGLYSFFLFIPGIVFASPIGSVVDDCQNLKKLLIASLTFSAISVLAILVMIVLGVHNFALLTLMAVVYSVLCDFYTPIISKIIILTFEKDEYMKLNADISTAMTSANLFSGVIVTALVSLIGSTGVFGIDALSCIIVIFMVMFLDVPDNIEVSHGNSKSSNVLVSGFGESYRFLSANHFLVPVLLGAVLFNVVLAPLDVYLTQIAVAHDSSKMVGILDSLFSCGFLISSVAYRFLTDRIKIHQFISLALIQVPVALLMMGGTSSLVVSSLGLLVLGAAIPLYNISLKTVFQNKIPQECFGTVSNCLYALINLSQPVGLLGVPVFLSVFGIQKYSVAAFIFYVSLALALIGSNKISVELDV